MTNLFPCHQLTQISEERIRVNVLNEFNDLDKIGEIIALFYKDKKDPLVSIRRTSVTVKTPTIDMKELNVNSAYISCVLEAARILSNTEKVFRYFSEKVNQICEINNVRRSLEFDMKATFMYCFEKKEEADKYYKELLPRLPRPLQLIYFDVERGPITFEIKTGDTLTADIEMKRVVIGQDCKEGFIYNITLTSKEKQPIKHINKEFLERMELNLKSALDMYLPI